MRLLIALSLFALASAAAVAQDAASAEGAADVALVMVDDVPELHVRRGGTITLAQLLELHCNITGQHVISSGAVLSFAVTISRPTDNRPLRGDDMHLLIANALEAARLALRPTGPGVAILSPTTEMAANSPLLDDTTLETANAASWGVYVFKAQTVDAQVMRQALQRLVNHLGGMVLAAPPSAVAIVDRVDRIRGVVATAREIDSRKGFTLKAYQLAEGQDAEAAAKHLTDLFGGTAPGGSAKFSGVVASRRVLAWARAEHHEQVPALLELLK